MTSLCRRCHVGIEPSPSVTENADDYDAGFAAAFGSIAANQNTERTDTR